MLLPPRPFTGEGWGEGSQDETNPWNLMRVMPP